MFQAPKDWHLSFGGPNRNLTKCIAAAGRFSVNFIFPIFKKNKIYTELRAAEMQLVVI